MSTDIIDANNIAFLSALVRKQARKLEAVTSIAARLEGSKQVEDREIAEDIYAALEATK
jgi:hypothetical protein